MLLAVLAAALLVVGNSCAPRETRGDRAPAVPAAAPEPAPDRDGDGRTPQAGTGQAGDAGAAGTSGAPGARGGGEAFPGFDLAPLVQGLREPLYVTHAGDGSGRLFIVERRGTVRIWRDGRLLPEPFADLGPLVATGGPEQGLLSIAFHPDFARNGRVFASYTDRDGHSVVARYRVRADDPDRLDPGSAEMVLRVEQPYANHNGGLILFGPDGYLYVGLGDGGWAGDPHGHGQNRNTLLGALLRLDVDGERGYAIPADNPFARGGGRPEIWAFGLRNPWRFSFDRETGDLYIGDVGQDAREEIDFQPAGDRGGRNYGWSVWEGTRRFRPDREPVSEVTFPVAEYDNLEDGCAVTGGYVYRGQAVPALRGVYVFGDFCSGTIWGLRRGGDGRWRKAELLRTDLRIASFGEDEAGELYVVDYRGAVYRFVPGPRQLPPDLAAPLGHHVPDSLHGA